MFRGIRFYGFDHAIFMKQLSHHFVLCLPCFTGAMRNGECLLADHFNNDKTYCTRNKW
jgi:hypothetical protein